MLALGLSCKDNQMTELKIKFSEEDGLFEANQRGLAIETLISFAGKSFSMSFITFDRLAEEYRATVKVSACQLNHYPNYIVVDAITIAQIENSFMLMNDTGSIKAYELKG
jgi:hypothetical protein